MQPWCVFFLKNATLPNCEIATLSHRLFCFWNFLSIWLFFGMSEGRGLFYQKSRVIWSILSVRCCQIFNQVCYNGRYMMKLLYLWLLFEVMEGVGMRELFHQKFHVAMLPSVCPLNLQRCQIFLLQDFGLMICRIKDEGEGGDKRAISSRFSCCDVTK